MTSCARYRFRSRARATPSSLRPWRANSHLLSFRHFFRQAYAVELDMTRLIEHRKRVARVHADVVEGIGRLLAHVEATLESLEEGTPV